jgi:hypothetical protein
MDGNGWRKNRALEPVDVDEIGRSVLRPYTFEMVRRGLPGAE